MCLQLIQYELISYPGAAIRANPTTFALHRPVEGAFFVRHLSAAVGGTSPLGEALGCEGSP